MNMDSPLAECSKAELFRLMDTLNALAAEFEENGGWDCSLGQVWEQVCAQIDRRALASPAPF
jgi:hypothetical protein